MTIILKNLTTENILNPSYVLRTIFSDINDKNKFSIIFVDEAEIHRLNLSFRHIDKPTDVLSFEDDEKNYLGDVFICYNIAKSQAVEFKQTLEREILYLSLHGYLHLKGYDHQTPETEKEMHHKVLELLNEKKNKDLLC